MESVVIVLQLREKVSLQWKGLVKQAGFKPKVKTSNIQPKIHGRYLRCQSDRFGATSSEGFLIRQ